MPRTIRRRIRVGPDRILHIQLPDDFPTGEVDVTVREREAEPPSATADDEAWARIHENLRKLTDPNRPKASTAERKRAAAALQGMFKGNGHVVDDFLRERREDDERRERALGL